MIFLKEFGQFIDNLTTISEDDKSHIKTFTLNLLNTEKISSKRNIGEVAEYILDMFDRYPTIDRNLKREYLIYCLRQLEKK